LGNDFVFMSVYRWLTKDKIEVSPADHQISRALYFSDPDGNGLEVCWDTWQAAEGAEIWNGRDRPLREKTWCLNEPSDFNEIVLR